MKKFFNYLLCLSLIIVTAFVMVGCGDSNSHDEDAEPTKLSFEQLFEVSEVETYKEVSSATQIDDLIAQTYYKKIVFKAKQDCNFSQFTVPSK